jgi:hypothetical protein
MMTREQRLRDREVRRILHAEQLAKEQEQLDKLAEEEANGIPNTSRISERQLKADVERRKKELEELAQEEEWVFDCSVCGVHGKNIDDGTHSIACDKCNVWQHSACHSIDKAAAESDDFHFVCKFCQHKEKNPVPALKLKFGPKDQPVKPKKPRAPKTATPKSKATTSINAAQSSPHTNGIGASQATFVAGQIPPLTQNPNRLAYPGPPAPAPAPAPRVFANPHSGSRPLPVATAAQSQPSARQHVPTNGAAHLRPGYQPQFQYSQQHPSQAQRQPIQPYQSTTFHHYRPAQSLPQANGIGPSPSRYLPPPNHPYFHPGGTVFGKPAAENYPKPKVAPSGPSLSPVQFQPYTPRQPQNDTAASGPQRSTLATPTGPSSLPQMRGPGSSPPTPHLPSPLQGQPSPRQGQPQLSASQAALQGSSPGYSPTKPPSPPRHTTTMRQDIERSITSPPIALQPQRQPQILSPPVKKSSPVHSSPISMVGANMVPNGQRSHNGHVSQQAAVGLNVQQSSPAAQHLSPYVKAGPNLPPIGQPTVIQNGGPTQAASNQQGQQSQEQAAPQAPRITGN